MNLKTCIIYLLAIALSLPACVSKKQFASLQTQLDEANQEVGKCGNELNDYMLSLIHI